MSDDRELSRAFASRAARTDVGARPRRRGRLPSNLSFSLLLVAGAAIVIIAAALGTGLRELRLTPSTAGNPTNSSGVTTSASELFVIGTAQGDVRIVGPFGLGDRLFDCQGRPVARLERSPDGRSLFVMCRGTNDSGEAYGEGFILEPSGPHKAIPLVLLPSESAWAPDGGKVALLAQGTGCQAGPPWLPQPTPETPGCRARVITYDLASGDGVSLGDEALFIENLHWTSLGLTHFRRGEDGGTFLWAAGEWRRLLDDRIADVAADGRLLLDRVAPALGGSRHEVVVWADGAETTLTPASLSESALLFDGKGRAVALREEAGRRSSIVIYDQDGGASVASGEFGTVAVEADGLLASIASSNRLVFYYTSDGRFRSVRVPDSITALGLRPQ